MRRRISRRAKRLSAGDRDGERTTALALPSICDFELWPRGEAPRVPMLSRWRMQEQRSGVKGLPQLQFVFLELPKYEGGNDPQTFVDKWAYFFREAENLMAIPEALRHPPLLDALEGARTAR